MFASGTLTGYFFLSRDRVILDLTVFSEAREIVVCRLGFRNTTQHELWSSLRTPFEPVSGHTHWGSIFLLCEQGQRGNTGPPGPAGQSGQLVSMKWRSSYSSTSVDNSINRFFSCLFNVLLIYFFSFTGPSWNDGQQRYYRGKGLPGKTTWLCTPKFSTAWNLASVFLVVVVTIT